MIARMKYGPVKPEPTTPLEETCDGVDSFAAVSEPLFCAAVSFPVVGIGASAGGLAAFEAFFSAISLNIDTGMAFVLIQHLAPGHKSLLAEIVRRYTPLPVFEAVDGMVVEPNCVYVVPPKVDTAILNGALQLLEATDNSVHSLPIDYFFGSLAQDQQENAIGIVLSGTGCDGTKGVYAIKVAGGFVVAQSPESAEFDGMPKSAIASGMVDCVLAPREISGKLIEHSTRRHDLLDKASSSLKAKVDESYSNIFVLLRARTGHDFSRYKKNTITRRIKRRMAVHQFNSLGSYVQFLRQTPAEIDALFNDFLIGVTNFFRDAEAFERLASDIIPRLFIGKQAGDTVRVWACGCSTGEEAYSIAILLQEYIDKVKKNFKVQLFATDIDSHAIEIARKGLYPASIVKDVTPERIEKYFICEEDGRGFSLIKVIRDMLIFSKHDVIMDPAFLKLDLISCRNLLIYLGTDLQRKLIPLFHYSLNPNGMLFLGTSEGITDSTNLFVTLDSHLKLYKRDDASGVNRLSYEPLSAKNTIPSGNSHRSPQISGEASRSPREIIEQILLQKYAPVSILVSGSGEIVYIYGRTGRFLEFAPGDVGINILRSAREGLGKGLTKALRLAVLHKKPVFVPGLRVRTNGDFSTVNLTVEPASGNIGSPQSPALFVVIIEEIADAEPHEQDVTRTLDMDAGPGTDQNMFDAKIALLTQKLLDKEETLYIANMGQADSTEELMSVNEELQSLNEELQSTNEELDTSKEELQSVNEELYSVNTELHNKVIDLSRANNDMNNLLAGTGVGTVFVNRKQSIQRFTPAATKVINLIETDVGRPLGHTVSNLVGYSRLVEDVQEVLDNLVPKNIEVRTRSGVWYLMCIRPYRTLENDIEGIVLTFTEIDDQVNARNNLQRLAVIVRDGYDAITVQDLDGNLLAWNPAAEKMYGWSEAEALTMNVSDLIPPHLHADHVKKIVSLGLAKVLKPFRTQKNAKNGRIVELLLTSTALINSSGQMYAIATTEREIVSKQKADKHC